MDKAGQQRQYGSAQRYADLAGGPMVFRGGSYQTAVACLEVLRLLAWQQRAPLTVLQVTCESRALVEGGQLGFDVRVREPGEDVQVEAKSSPLPNEVKELIGRLPAFEGAPDRRMVLVHGKATGWTHALDRLVRYAQEAVDDVELDGLLVAAGDVDLNVLAAAVPASAGGRRLLLTRMLPPRLLPVDWISGQVERDARAMAGDRAPELVSTVSEEIEDASKARRTIVTSELLGRLVKAGVLAQLDVRVPSGDPLLSTAVAVLDRCPAPLPEPVLAAALGLEPGGARTLLHDLIGARHVLEDGELVWRPAGAVRVSAVDAGNAVRDVLDGLLSIPDALHPQRVAQVPNVLSLCQELAGSEALLVAGAFRKYDKAVKATGNLSAVYALSSLSLGAATRASGSGAATADLLELRGHARICGVAWTLQRVGCEKEASDQMDHARTESADADSRDNLAFVDKCHGRLSRLQAEELVAAGEHEQAGRLFDLSRAQLEAAYTAFLALLLEPGFERLAEEPGECVGLRARTELSAGDLDEAERWAGRAHEELDYLRPQRKAWADVCMVEAEVALARTRGGETSGHGGLERQAGRLQEVVGEFEAAASNPSTVDVGASEVLARTYMVLALLAQETGAPDRAADLFDRAAEQFERVDQGRLAYRCRAQALDLTGAFPAKLQEVLEQVAAGDAVRVEAHRLHALRPVTDAPERYWSGLVAGGREAAAANAHVWTDRRAG